MVFGELETRMIAPGLESASPRILVFGDLILDDYIHGSARRISPEAPVPVVEVANRQQTLGGAGNVINNLVEWGAQVTPLSGRISAVTWWFPSCGLVAWIPIC